MAYSGRALSPGSRRIANGARASESTLTTDSGYHSHRHNSYTAPRSNTGGVIPISKETFINIPAPRDPRPAERIDTYSGRPRKSSLVDAYRGSASTSNLLPVRSSGRPNVIQNDIGRSSSPPKSSREKEYYITPASSQEHRGGQHKKLYSIDDGTAKLVADVNIPADRNHRRRESGDRGLYRANGPERDRGRRGYHTIYRDKSIDDDDAFSYTDPAGMYRETEPRWSRPRRGSLDRGGVSRERPTSMIEPDPRRTTINVGPPPSTRGWDKINRSSREVGTSPNRSRGYTDGVFIDVRDPYHIRGTSADRRHPTVHQDRYDGYDYEDRREAPRRYERRNSITRGDRPDRSVERRGFGIRSDSRSNSQNRYRSSDENFEQTRYREAGYAEPRRRETAPPEPAFHDDRRYEQERKDREYAERLQQDEFNRGGYRDETRHHDRGAPRDRDFDVDRERERERIRQMEPPSDRDRHRQESYDRDASRKDSSPPRGSDITSQPSLAQAAVGGLAATAAAAGIAGAVHGGEKRDGERRSNPRTSDERLNREAAERDRLRDGDRGLGFAFEGPPESQRPRGASTSNPERPPERPRDVIPPPAAPRDAEREHEGSRKVEMPAPAIDPDEEYRRRMEQVQRELGAASDTHHSSDSDPDRVRRRREREQRLRGRELENRNGAAAAAVADVRVNGGMPVPQHFARRSHEDEQSMLSANTATTAEQLRRRPSILDRPMTDEPAQIIDNSNSSRHENRVRIVDPPTEEEEKRPKGILKKPTEKFPENPDEVREGVAPMKDSTKKGIPPGAKWTKIDRRLVNPASLDEAGERYEERLDHVIVLRVLTKEDIQKLADRTREIREKAYEEDRKARRRDRDRDRDRRDRDEYSEDDSADEFKKKAPRMLDAPASTVSGGGSSGAGGGGGGGSFSDDGTSSREQRRRERERERERERDRDRERD